MTDPTPIPVTEADITHVEFHHEDASTIDADEFWDLVNGSAMTIVDLSSGDVMTLSLSTNTHKTDTERWACTILTGSFPTDGDDISVGVWPAS